MCNLNLQKGNNSLLSVIERWWPTQKENLTGLRHIDAKAMLRFVLLCLEDLRNTKDCEDCKKTAGYLPTKIATEIENLCENAPANDRKRCAACVCMLVSACMTMINVTTIGNRKLMWAQSSLQRKMEQFENVDQLFDDLWKCIEECGAEEVAECARMLYDGTGRNETKYFPLGFLSSDKVSELYMLLRTHRKIEESVTEDDFLQLFGCKNCQKGIAPIKWLLNKDDLLLLLKGIYDKWEDKEKHSWTSITAIAHTHFVKEDGTQYNEQMKLKTSYKGKNIVISDFLATL